MRISDWSSDVCSSDLSGEVARRHGHAGLADDTVLVRLRGTAGQSFGAFLARGVTLELTGDANDYVGKGLSGGRVIVRQPDEAKREAATNIIVGNTVLYGAIEDEAFFNGVAGRSEEHTSELQSLMRISYAVFC